MMGRAKRTGLFWDKVEKTDSCWIWTASSTPKGYGAFRVNGRLRPAHRHAWELANGTIPDGLVVDHTCYVRRCVNVAHMRLVTAGQNNQNRAGANRNSKSGIRGVSWNARKGKWAVRAREPRGRYLSGGYFSDLKDAEAAAIRLRNAIQTHNDADRLAA